MINLNGIYICLLNTSFLFVLLFSCLHLEDTIKIKLDKINEMYEVNKINEMNEVNKINEMNEVNKINEMNEVNKINEMNEVNKINEMNEVNKMNEMNACLFLKVCCADFCSFLEYDITKKTYLIIRENILLYNCKNIVKLYFSSDNAFFYFTNFIFMENDIVEIVDSFEKEKRNFTFWKPLFEFLQVDNGKKYIFIPLAYFEIKNCNNKLMKRNESLDKKINNTYDTHKVGFTQLEKKKEVIHTTEQQKKEDMVILNVPLTSNSPNEKKGKFINSLLNRGKYLPKINFSKSSYYHIGTLIQIFTDLILDIKKEKVNISIDPICLPKNNDASFNSVLNYIDNTSNGCTKQTYSTFHKIYYKNYLFKIILISNPILLFLFEDMTIWNSDKKKDTDTSLYICHKKNVYKCIPPKNYKAILEKAAIIFLIIILILLTYILLRNKKLKIKEQKKKKKNAHNKKN
ncbi:conserved Plasmodium protein, unknown function [Plasmodium malariae]|uniref:Uncharacterized protein n=1 Tax=Plasmodium malariae TaxID=5858 RepID=A0A1C3KY36_PLAMA|nr:conserved Plasmodium protein, unknown function [Plasmodium malariae]